MTKTKKSILVVACAIMLVAMSVMGTLAWLQDKTDPVKNTFTVGNIEITLDEAPVDENGKIAEGSRVLENKYKLMPGYTYDKDPTVHVVAGSEECWLFVKVENGISDIEATNNTIAAQITGNGWTELTGVNNVYYKAAVKDVVDHVVFEEFTINAEVDNNTIAANKNDSIVITAYAIQTSAGDTAYAAWNAGGFN